MNKVTIITCVLDGLTHYYGTYDCEITEENRAEIKRQIFDKYPSYREVLVSVNRRKVEKCFSYRTLNW